MRQLKYYRQGQPHGKMDNQEADKPGPPTQQINRKQDIEESIQQLSGPKYHVLFCVDPPDRRIMDLLFKVLDKVRSYDPGKGAHPIKHKHIEELEAMDGHPFLGGAKPQYRAFGNII